MGASIQKTPDFVINPHDECGGFLAVVQHPEAVTCATLFKITGLAYLNLLHSHDWAEIV
jgi:hypothetical protein